MRILGHREQAVVALGLVFAVLLDLKNADDTAYKQAVRSWLESQNFKVVNSQDKPEGSWWFEAENPKMSFRKIRVRWNVNEKPTLEVNVS
jgi:hypothetical protein